MDKNDEKLDPLRETRKEVPTQKAGDKPANDVLNAEESDSKAESQFVHSTRREVDDKLPEAEPSEKEGLKQPSERSMPDTQRLTEDD